ncbi:hypothetical protein IMZ48_04580, partial [Candidatus Bathyarchaeota archaeon]|nr:hypothetical protein [Candidatus Bathyarchaeota archaeon]
EALEYPCYALFLDPANALILTSTARELHRDASGKEDPERIVPAGQLTSSLVDFNVARNPGLRGNVFQSLHASVRIGVGAFVKGTPKGEAGEGAGPGKDKAPQAYDPKKHGELKLENILHVSGDESWGPVTDKDSKVRMAIV